MINIKNMIDTQVRLCWRKDEIPHNDRSKKGLIIEFSFFKQQFFEICGCWEHFVVVVVVSPVVVIVVCEVIVAVVANVVIIVVAVVAVEVTVGMCGCFCFFCYSCNFFVKVAVVVVVVVVVVFEATV